MGRMTEDAIKALFNLICQKSSTSKVGDEGRSGEFT